MKPWVSRAIVTAGFGLGVWLLTAAPAHADTSDTTVARATLTLRLDLPASAAAPNAAAESPSGLAVRGTLRVRSGGVGTARGDVRAAGTVVATAGASPRTTKRRPSTAVVAVRARTSVLVSPAPLAATRRPVTDPAVAPGPISGRVCIVVGPGGCRGANGSSGTPAAPSLSAAAALAVSATAPAGATGSTDGGGSGGGAGSGPPVQLPEDTGSGVSPVAADVLAGLRGGTGLATTTVGAGGPSLPRTGVAVRSMMAVGLAMLGLGVLLLLAGRRRRA